MGSTAGGVLQTSQRIGSAVGQAVIGAAFFAALTPAASGSGPARHAAYGVALTHAVYVTLLFVAAALVFGIVDLTTRGQLGRRRGTGREAPPPGP
jgi:hypothetical protein